MLTEGPASSRSCSFYGAVASFSPETAFEEIAAAAVAYFRGTERITGEFTLGEPSLPP